MNVSEFLSISALIVPDREAIVFGNQRITYEKLQNRVNRLANALSDLGVKSGDRIAAMQVNCNEHIETYLAAAKLDAIFVPINFRARSEELSFMLNDSGSKVLIFGHRYQEMVGEIKEELKSVEHFIVLENPQEGFLFFASFEGIFYQFAC